MLFLLALCAGISRAQDAASQTSSPLGLSLKDGALQLNGRYGIIFSGMKLRINLSDGKTLTGDLQFVETTKGGDSQSRNFEQSRYQFNGAKGTSAANQNIKAALVVRRYLQPEIFVAWLEYEGAPLRAKDGAQLIMRLDAFARGFAEKRLKLYWTSPVFTSDYRTLSPSNQLLLWQRINGDEFHLLASLAGGGMISTIGFDEIDYRYEFRVAASRDDPQFAPRRVPLFAYAASNDPYKLPRDLYAAAFAANETSGRLRWEKGYPETFRSLGWCSWNAYYHQVSEEKIIRSVRSLREQKIPFGFILVDDGWLTVKDDRLAGYDADATKFPHGLGGLVKTLRDDYKVPHVGVWHTFQGYWSGVDKDTEIGRAHKLFDGDGGKSLPDPRGGAGESFYDDWYKFLRAAGIDFVKVDNQASNGKFTDGLMPLFASGSGAQANLQQAAQNYFSDSTTSGAQQQSAVNLINCMAMSLENAFNWRASNIARNSDDYLPDSPQNVKEHIYQNAYNAYWTANFAFPDWDMFQTHDPHGEFHAVARAVSGGPVYFTDEPGKERPEILRRLAFSDGKLLMADEPAQVTRDTLLVDTALEAAPLKIFNRVKDGRSEGVTGFVAAFNVNKSAHVVSGALNLNDVEGLSNAKSVSRFAVYQRTTNRAAILGKERPSLPFSLDEFGFELFTLAPVDEGFAAFGLLDKYLGAAAIMYQNRQANVVTIRLREAGDFGAWTERAPAKIEIDGRALPASAFSYERGLLRVPRASFGKRTGERELRVTLSVRRS